MPMSLTRLYIHYVWGTAHREPLITATNREAILQCIVGKCQSSQVQVLALNGVADHMHLLIKFTPLMTIAKLIADIKGASSHLARQKWPTDPFQWQHGNGAFTVSESAVPAVRRYIANQEAHHTTTTCQLIAALDDHEERPRKNSP